MSIVHLYMSDGRHSDASAMALSVDVDILIAGHRSLLQVLRFCLSCNTRGPTFRTIDPS